MLRMSEGMVVSLGPGGYVRQSGSPQVHVASPGHPVFGSALAASQSAALAVASRLVQRQLPRQVFFVFFEDEVDTFTDVNSHWDLRPLMKELEPVVLLRRDVNRCGYLFARHGCSRRRSNRRVRKWAACRSTMKLRGTIRHVKSATVFAGIRPVMAFIGAF